MNYASNKSTNEEIVVAETSAQAMLDQNDGVTETSLNAFASPP